MIIAIEYLVDDVVTRTYLAGDPAVSPTRFAHATDYLPRSRRLISTHRGAGWAAEKHRNLGNVGHTISFSTAREFDTYPEAEAFINDLASLPLEGTLVILSPSEDGLTATKRIATNAVGNVEPQGIQGVWVRYGFTFECGLITTDVSEDLVTRTFLTSPEGDTLTSPEGDEIGAPVE